MSMGDNVQYQSECDAFPFEQIPKRVFLDTNVVDCLVKWGECVFEQQEIPVVIHPRLRSDVVALTNIFLVGRRAQWDIVISDRTINELSNTSDELLRRQLLLFGGDLAQYARANGLTSEDRKHARSLARRLVDARFLSALPDRNDRELISHAIGFGCDTFCTRDLKSIHKKRDKLRLLPLRILTPGEWWAHIRPWAALWI